MDISQISSSSAHSVRSPLYTLTVINVSEIAKLFPGHESQFEEINAITYGDALYTLVSAGMIWYHVVRNFSTITYEEFFSLLLSSFGELPYINLEA
jgi:hypothetical protein